MASILRKELAGPLVAALGGCLLIAGCSDVPDPSGSYKASFDLTDPLAKGLVPDEDLTKLNGESRFLYNIEFSEPPLEASDADGTALCIHYSSESKYVSKDPESDAKLHKEYQFACQAFEKSLKGNWPDKDSYMSRAFAAYQQLDRIPFSRFESGGGQGRRDKQKVICELYTRGISSAPDWPPGVINCYRIPALKPNLQIVLRIDRNGDLVVESVAPAEPPVNPPIGLRFTKQ